MTAHDAHIAFLRKAVRDFAIDPVDAQEIARELVDSTDWETLGDYLDGAGYPELASDAYTREEGSNA